jgi:hypothetical protein
MPMGDFEKIVLSGLVTYGGIYLTHRLSKSRRENHAPPPAPPPPPQAPVARPSSSPPPKPKPSYAGENWTESQWSAFDMAATLFWGVVILGLLFWIAG